MGISTRVYETSELHADVTKEIVRSHAWATCRGLTARNMLMHNNKGSINENKNTKTIQISYETNVNKTKYNQKPQNYENEDRMKITTGP